MKLSVIIPVYNLAPYIETSVASVFVQTGCEIECICVDDGSSDGSLAVLERLSRDYANRRADFTLKVVHQENAGVSAARNTGLSVATGDWVAFLDGDDTWAPNFCSAVAPLVQDDPDLDALCFGMVYVDEKGERVRAFGGPIDFSPCRVLGDALLQKGRGPYSRFVWSSCDKLFRRARIEELGLLFDTRLRVGEDSLFAQMFLAQCGYVRAEPIEGYRYLERQGSAIKTIDEVPKDPYARIKALVERFGKNLTPGLRTVLRYDLAGAPSLGKEVSPDYRSRCIAWLLDAPDFNDLIVGLMLRYGSPKSRLFALVYRFAPHGVRRAILKRL